MNKSDPFGGVSAETGNVSASATPQPSGDGQYPEPVQADHVGALLCATRMRLGGDLQDIARILKIRYGYLVAIEDGRFEDLPGNAYSIGFVRAYADFLGLDGNEVVRRLREETTGSVAPTRFEFPVHKGDSGLPTGGILSIAIVLGMVVYSGWFVFTNDDRNAVDLIQEVPERLTALLGTEQASEPNSVAGGSDQSSPPLGALNFEQTEVSAKDFTAQPETGGGEGSEQIALSDAQQEVAVAPNNEVVIDANAIEEPEAETAEDVAVESASLADSGANESDSPGGEAAVQSPQAIIPGLDQARVPETDVESVPQAGTNPEPAREPEEDVAVVEPQPSEDEPETTVSETSPATQSEDEQQPVNARTQGARQDAETALRESEPIPDEGERLQPEESVSDSSAAVAGLEPVTEPSLGATNEPDQSQEDVSVESASAPGVIELRAKSDSWIQVRDGNDLLLTRLLRKGEVYRVPDREGLTLMTGNAGGLEVFIGGDLAPPLGNEGVVRRGVPLNAESLRSGVAPG